MFTPLMQDEIKQIVSLQIKQLKKMVAKNNVQIEVTDGALELLSENGFDPQYGARPLKRLIQKEIVNELSKRLLAGEVTGDNKIVIDADKGEIVFKNKKVKQMA
jgi:ATP-dependent Clp protease ATP-binding subunit ClpB